MNQFHRLKRILLICLFSWLSGTGISIFAQAKDTINPELKINLEIRPRLEYFNNYVTGGLSRKPDQFLITQRNRIGFTYIRQGFRLHGSLQEIHLWGADNKISSVASVNAFELYAEGRLAKNLDVRVGRQALALDNGRLFSAAPWAQQSRSHEALRMLYSGSVNTDLTIAFTRRYATKFESGYSPVASHQYKYLVVHHLKSKIANYLTLTTLNVLDAFDDSLAPSTYFKRFTNGGRLEFNTTRWYATIAGYYQYGRTNLRKIIKAYYFQPEISMSEKRITVRLGAEILSGESTTGSAAVSRSFVPLYGVAWKFMGNMNFFVRFPADVRDRGLINPYLFFIYKTSPIFSLRADTHLFYSKHLLDYNQGDQNKYLGFETDLSFNYKPRKNIEINFGQSFFLPGKSAIGLGKLISANKTASWTYCMIAFGADIFSKCF